MSSPPEDRRYTTSHEWARQDGELITVGLTEYAIGQLGDLVFVEFPEVGDKVTAGDPFGEIESVKAVAELKSPVSGSVAEVNQEIEDTLEVLAESPYEKGWLIKIKFSDAAEFEALMDSGKYGSTLEE